jgi:hypothetical protein
VKKIIIQLLILIFILPLNNFALSKDNFFKQLDTWEPPANNKHPRLYFDQKGSEKLFKQFKSATPRLLSFLSECDSIITRPLPDYSNYNQSRYIARSESEKLSFAYAITQKVEYANYAKKIIKQMVQWKDWVYEEHKPRRVDLGVAGVGYILALCYDWLYPVLSATERQDIEEAVLNQALNPFLDVYTHKSEEWTHVNHNWRSVICGEMGIIALTVLENVPDAKKILNFAIDGVVDVLNHGGIDGGWNEGVSYWGYGIGQAMMFVEAMYQVSEGAVDLYELPFLKVTGDFGLYTRTPNGDSFNFSDCNPGPPNPWLLALLASHFQNPYWQWSAQKDIGNSIPDILFYDPDFPAVKPINFDLGKHFKGIQVAAMRSSWEKDAIFLGFKTGKSLVNHSQLDLNSFVLHAFGKPLLIDLYNWPYAHYLGFFDFENQRWDFEGNHTVGHNTLLVDGRGQGYGEKFEGRIFNFSSTKNMQYAVGEANAAYGNLLNKFHRYIALIDGKFLILVDDIKSTELRKLEWLMHYSDFAKESNDGVFKISNQNANLDFIFLRPSKAENRIISFERHETSYKATRETTTQINKFISISPLHRQKNYRFIAAAFPYNAKEFSDYSTKILSESEDRLKIRVEMDGTTYSVTVNFVSNIVEFSILK